MQLRVVIGRDVDVIQQGTDEIELFGRVRLRPGFKIEIRPGAGRPNVNAGFAIVQSWHIRVLGSNGPIYRGVCRWYPSVIAKQSGAEQSSLEIGAKRHADAWHTT